MLRVALLALERMGFVCPQRDIDLPEDLSVRVRKIRSNGRGCNLNGRPLIEVTSEQTEIVLSETCRKRIFLQVSFQDQQMLSIPRGRIVITGVGHL